MATVSDAIRMVFTKSKCKQTNLAARWFTTRQAISNKFYRDYWSADELVDVARFAGASLVFKFPDGMEIPIITDSAPRLSVEKAEKE